MNLTTDRLRSVGWFALIAVCAALTLALTVKVNAVKSHLRSTEHRIAQVRQEKRFLETEFETRANQQQLTQLNAVDFGYHAPGAGQSVEGERQLALLGKPRGPDAPNPLRVASADPGKAAATTIGIPAMVNPVTGKPLTPDAKADLAEPQPTPSAPSGLGDRLSRIDPRAASGAAHE